MLTVRQTDDVVVHLPPMMVSSNTSTMPSYMVIALHGMGPNYPDLFQHEVKKEEISSAFFPLTPQGGVGLFGG